VAGISFYGACGEWWLAGGAAGNNGQLARHAELDAVRLERILPVRKRVVAWSPKSEPVCPLPGH
jgi:hypothetical protein